MATHKLADSVIHYTKEYLDFSADMLGTTLRKTFDCQDKLQLAPEHPSCHHIAQGTRTSALLPSCWGRRPAGHCRNFGPSTRRGMQRRQNATPSRRTANTGCVAGRAVAVEVGCDSIIAETCAESIQAIDTFGALIEVVLGNTGCGHHSHHNTKLGNTSKPQ